MDQKKGSACPVPLYILSSMSFSGTSAASFAQRMDMGLAFLRSSYGNSEPLRFVESPRDIVRGAMSYAHQRQIRAHPDLSGVIYTRIVREHCPTARNNAERTVGPKSGELERKSSAIITIREIENLVPFITTNRSFDLVTLLVYELFMDNVGVGFNSMRQSSKP